MVTLLLTLFVFLVAMSDLHKDPPSHPAVIDAPTPEGQIPYEPGEPWLRTEPRPVPLRPEAPAVPDPAAAAAATDLVPAETVPPDLLWLRDRAAELEALARSNDLAQAMTVERTGRSLVVEVRDGVLFASARADLTADGAAVIRRLASLLASMPAEIEVEGHTDPVPIRTDRYPSNWELSAARAAAVARKLIDNGVPADRIKAVGRADTRPVAPNTTAEGRAANRRVVLLIHARTSEPNDPTGGR